VVTAVRGGRCTTNTISSTRRPGKLTPVAAHGAEIESAMGSYLTPLKGTGAGAAAGALVSLTREQREAMRSRRRAVA
jgi:hypothetical protein